MWGGTLTFSGSNGDLGSTALSGSSFPVTVTNPAFVPASSGVQYLAPLSGGSSLPVSTTNGTLITGADNTNTTYSGVISGNGSVIKTGKGWWTLTGENTYTGLTTVADGGLSVNGSIPGDVFVLGGGVGW